MSINFIAIGLSLAIFIFVLDLIRREKLTFKYALSWLVVSALGIFFSFFPKVLFVISDLCGFILPSNFIFFSLMCAFVFLSLLLTVFLCQQNRRNDRLVQRMALLENEIESIKSQRGSDS